VEPLLLVGGSFNPVHHGHLIVSRFAAEQLGLVRVTLVPASSPPHKRAVELAPAPDRLAMCRLVAAEDPLFTVSDCEIIRPGPNYTIDTIEHFRRQAAPDTPIYWLIGMDSLHELESWHRAAELVDRCTIVSVSRPGFEPPAPMLLGRRFSQAQVDKLLAHMIEGPRIDISGSEIRARVRAGRSIRYLVPEAVRRYIDQHRLYR